MKHPEHQSMGYYELGVTTFSVLFGMDPVLKFFTGVEGVVFNWVTPLLQKYQKSRRVEERLGEKLTVALPSLLVVGVVWVSSRFSCSVACVLRKLQRFLKTLRLKL